MRDRTKDITFPKRVVIFASRSTSVSRSTIEGIELKNKIDMGQRPDKKIPCVGIGGFLKAFSNK